jgi:hypothetical protein
VPRAAATAASIAWRVVEERLRALGGAPEEQQRAAEAEHRRGPHPLVERAVGDRRPERLDAVGPRRGVPRPGERPGRARDGVVEAVGVARDARERGRAHRLARGGRGRRHRVEPARPRERRRARVGRRVERRRPREAEVEVAEQQAPRVVERRRGARAHRRERAPATGRVRRERLGEARDREEPQPLGRPRVGHDGLQDGRRLGASLAAGERESQARLGERPCGGRDRGAQRLEPRRGRGHDARGVRLRQRAGPRRERRGARAHQGDPPHELDVVEPAHELGVGAPVGERLARGGVGIAHAGERLAQQVRGARPLRVVGEPDDRRHAAAVRAEPEGEGVLGGIRLPDRAARVGGGQERLAQAAEPRVRRDRGRVGREVAAGVGARGVDRARDVVERRRRRRVLRPRGERRRQRACGRERPPADQRAPPAGALRRSKPTFR